MPVSLTPMKMEKASEIKPYQTLRGHTKLVTGVVHLHDGQRNITCSIDGSLRLWDRESGAQIGNDWRDDGDKAGVRAMSLSPDGQTVATGSDDGTVRLWDVEMRKVTAKWTGHPDTVWSLCWSADLRRIVTASNAETVRVWDVESGETVLGPIKNRHRYVNAVAYSPDTSKIATGGRNEEAVQIWDARTGKLLSTIEQDSYVRGLAWTSDQKRLIAGYVSGSIKIYNTTTWQEIAVLEGHNGYVLAISLLQNDRLLASGSDDYTARLWNLDTYLPVGPPLQHQDWVWDVALSADGKFLITACLDNNAYVWNIHTMLKDTGLEDLLSVPNKVVDLKSVLAANATRGRTKLGDTPTGFPQGFFNDMPDDGVLSSTILVDPVVSVIEPAHDHATTLPDAQSDPPQHPPRSEKSSTQLRGIFNGVRHRIHSRLTRIHAPSDHRHIRTSTTSLGSRARLLFSRFVPRFHSFKPRAFQPNIDESVELQHVISNSMHTILDPAGAANDKGKQREEPVSHMQTPSPGDLTSSTYHDTPTRQSYPAQTQVVGVPLAHGKHFYYSANQVKIDKEKKIAKEKKRKAKNVKNVMSSSKSTSSPTQSNAPGSVGSSQAQPYSEPQTISVASPSAATEATTPIVISATSPSHGITPQAGCWTRFWLWLFMCCTSAEFPNDHH